MPIQTKPLARKWRDVLTIHPAAELFPRMTPDELKALGADIEKNGQQQPIAIIEKAKRRPDGTLHVSDPPLQEVLDGISRLDAMESAGIQIIGEDGQLDPRIQRIEVDTDEVNPVAYVISANIHRRHLTAEQKRDLITKLIKATPEKSDRQIAETVKADHKTVGSVRTEMEGRGEIPHVETHTDTKGRKQPSRKPGGKGAVKKPRLKPQAAPADVQAIRDDAAKRIRALMGRPEPSASDDVGPTSAAEIARKDAEIGELRNAKRQLQIKITGLENEIEKLKHDGAPNKPPGCCPFCRESKQTQQRPVYICDRCVDLFEVGQKAEAPPLAADGLDIPDYLDRTKRRAAS